MTLALHKIYMLRAQDSGNDRRLMYARMLRKASTIRRFTITHLQSTGWDVRDEQDSRVLRRVVYHDWHRVERASLAFSLEVQQLLERGWEELN